ncbi:MAG: hypothetical protein CFE21_14640 [Bacteroidetes bacterium B1(2017)]|nr:MAG: hypothetical protein CFE21_14640 [Bacteroidetes bacterium B1(2017)]
MKKIILCLIQFLILMKMGFAQVPSQSRYTNAGRIGLSINNYGTYGRPTVRSNTQGPPSMAFPRGSGVEHLFESGIWIGALVNGQVRVSTSSVDASSGYSTGGSGFEFTQLSSIKERSKLPSSASYSSSAISHQDFSMLQTDSFVVIPGTSIPISGHQNPLGAVIKLETYAWNFPFADFFVICNYEITNTSTNRWDSVFLGTFSDLVVRNVNVTRDAGTAFFNKGRNGVDAKYNTLFAYQSYGDDIDFTKSYGAIQFLGIDWRGMFFNPQKPDTFLSLGYPAPRVNYNFWNFNSIATPWNTPSNDQERYLKLANTIDSTTLYGADGPILGVPANWLQLLSAGPIVNVNPGEKFNFTFAFVCAKQKEPLSYLPPASSSIVTSISSQKELTDNLKRTRATYVGEDVNEDGRYAPELDLNGNGKLDRYILPEPPESPLTKVITSESKIEVYWTNKSEYSIDPITRTRDFEGYRIYRSNAGDDLALNLISDANLISQWDSIGNDFGFNNGFSLIKLAEPKMFEGDTTKYYYKYTLDNISNGWQYLVVVTAFDKGDKILGIPSLESSFTENEIRAFAGTKPNDFTGADAKKVGVYPNPYNTTAAWDGGTSRTKKLYFYNLPSKCEIHIYTNSGDLIATLSHNSDTYKGEGIGWTTNYGNAEKTTMSGGEHAWDVLSDSKTTLSTGVYLFTVKDTKTGEIQSGSFAVIK